MQALKHRRVGEVLREYNIEFSTLYNFIVKYSKKKTIELTLNTWLDEKTVDLCRQEFIRDKITKKKSQQVKLIVPAANNVPGKPSLTDKKELKRYRSIIKQTRKKRAAKKTKGSNKSNKSKGYVKIVSGGLCNPR